MGLGYIYIIFSHHIAYTPILVWAGTKKHAAVAYLKEQLVNGVSMAEFQIKRMKDAQPDSESDIDVYEFMQIDLGEVM